MHVKMRRFNNQSRLDVFLDWVFGSVWLWTLYDGTEGVAEGWARTEKRALKKARRKVVTAVRPQIEERRVRL